MHKFVKWIWSLILVMAMFSLGILLSDRENLRTNLVRLHVVANSDTQRDQDLKLHVRDAVMAYLSEELSDISGVVEAKACILEKLDTIEKVASNTLASYGCHDIVTASLKEEAFPVREYDTFSLPSGVYQSLRIQIGDASGQNWWCVIFPSLCVPRTQDVFCETAVNSGVSDGLASTLTQDNGYEIRFFLLDMVGRLENFLFQE